MTATTRQPWIDHLRTAMIALVVNMHACVTYSHVGDWYAMSAREPTLAAKVPFIVWQGHLQAFFMGLLFFLAGHFAEHARERKGGAAFFRDRLRRLGLPALLYMLVLHPFIVLALNPWAHDFGPPVAWYARYVASGRFLAGSGPLWFAFALLIFCGVFALWPRRGDGAPATGRPPGARAILGFGVSLVVATFLIRLVQPIGKNVLNFQLCFFPQYVAGFAVGVASARGGWLRTLAESSLARRAGWIALVAGPAVLIAVMVSGGEPGEDARPYSGGASWQAFALAAWEQLAGLGLALGALSFFVRRANRGSRFLDWCGERAFGVYVLHAPVLVGLAMLFRPLEPLGPWVLVPLLTLAGLGASLLAADLVRRVPGLRAIL